MESCEQREKLAKLGLESICSNCIFRVKRILVNLKQKHLLMF